MIRRSLIIAMLLLPFVAGAQTQPEYAARRAALAARLPDGIFVALGAHEPAQDFLSFDQAPNFRYLTGFKEPDAALVMVKQNGAVKSATMFVQPRLPSREVWTGTRLGIDAVGTLTGIRGRNTAELHRMLDSLADLAMPFLVSGEFGAAGQPEGVVPVRTADEQLFDFIRRKHPSIKVTPVNDMVQQLRGTKSATEIILIRNAVDLAVRAQKEAIPAVHPGINEFELQALIEYTFRRNGADRPSFSTITGSGPNSTTLHYNANDRFIGSNDMIVMDIGASYKGYASDVTRSVPANGTFSPTQRAIYQVVRDAQRAAERQAKPGNAARLMSDSANAEIAAGLARLGLIESPGAMYDCSTGATPRQCAQYRLYYMHGLGHGIGLEVHDPEQYYVTGKIAVGSAFTIEPGIYVREHVLDEMPVTPRNSEIAARLRSAVANYRNIGVRIEDDYVCTASGVEWISQAPREIAEIEALMKTGTTGPAKRDEFRVEKYRTVP